MKKLFVSIIAALTLVLSLAGCGSTPDASPKVVQKVSSQSVSVAIQEGKVTRTAKVAIKKDETALSALQQYSKDHKVKVVVTGSGKMAYVTQIDKVKATKHSGWMFSVNGKTPKVGAGAFKLKAKDVVKWYVVKF